MVRPFFTAALLLLAYMGIAAGVIALTLQIFPPLAIVCVVLIVIGFVPVMNSIARWAFRFAGIGEPVAPHELRRRLLEVNDWNAPVSVQQTKPHTFDVTWRYLDPHWWEQLSSANIHQLYTLRIKFNDEQHEVVLVDRLRAVQWGTGPSEVRIGLSGFTGVGLEWNRGAQYDLRESFMPDTRSTATFAQDAIKTPVMNTILQSGWSVRMALW